MNFPTLLDVPLKMRQSKNIKSPLKKKSETQGNKIRFKVTYTRLTDPWTDSLKGVPHCLNQVAPIYSGNLSK